MRSLLTALSITLLVSGCVPPGTSTETTPVPEGPPEVSYELVRRHAQQFDVDVPDRPAGSQHETAAASYILGHLQLAGFSPRLDRVPVADTLNSTNVFAYPPNGSKPEYLVAVSYDTPASGLQQQGRELGLFLELARALTVADPDHGVAFAALGAENVDARGTRRLAQFLLDEDISPSVLLIDYRYQNEGSAYFFGSCMGDATGMGSDTLTDGECLDTKLVTAIVDAGFQLTYMGGDIEDLGRKLFDFLLERQS